MNYHYKKKNFVRHSILEKLWRKREGGEFSYNNLEGEPPSSLEDEVEFTESIRK